MNLTFNVKTYPQEGELQHTYSPLKNLLLEDNSIGFFRVKNFGIDLSHPLNVDCQPSYDGTVNLIINDDKNPPRIINTRFTKLEDNRFKIINRNQKEQTNLYRADKWDLQTRLFRTSMTLPKIHLVELNYAGQLKGGNYTFYIKFADSDYNQTDVLCESGQVSVFKGDLSNIKSISGTLADELTDKSIKLQVSQIDTSFSKFYIYYTREYSDLNGFRLTETVSVVNPYDITGTTQDVIINGYEKTENINTDELNIKYHYVTNVKTQAQVQNMLFFGNIENYVVNVNELQNISYFFKVQLLQKNQGIGYVNPNDYSSYQSEYYDPINIYYNLGYWPGEIYRLGVVYVMNDDSLSPVFNLRGCVFDKVGSSNFDSTVPTRYKINDKITYLEKESFLTETNLINTWGVFKNPNEDECPIINDEARSVNPWYYSISIDSSIRDELRSLGVKGYFFVRQKRIPITLCQGFSVGIDSSSNIPSLYFDGKYIAESFLEKTKSSGKTVLSLSENFDNRIIKSDKKEGSALLCVDATLNPLLQSSLSGNTFNLLKSKSGTLSKNGRHFYPNLTAVSNSFHDSPCIYIDEDVPYKFVQDFGFSTRAGTAESVKSFAYFGKNKIDIPTVRKDSLESDIVRGIYSSYIGVCGGLEDNSIYSIRVPGYSNFCTKDYFSIRANDASEFYAISDRFGLDEITHHNVYRGDCFTNTVTVRLNRNFTDPEVPVNDTIVDKYTWSDNYKGYYNMSEKEDEKDKDKGNWLKINRADLNTVPLGMWVTYKCLSSNNLGLRSEDLSYVDEHALMGNPRSFYPLSDMSVKSANKIAESKILNNGYSATVGRKTHLVAPNTPYTNDLYDTRVMFSNVQVNGDFKNGYRVFQGLAYKDIDRQYGAIVKLLDWGTNLFCVFEHGLAILPINEKALIQTTTEQSVHMYGAGVLQNQVSLISPDFGSIWPESVIRTPIGIYGVDTYAKKIWKYSSEKGLETISDMKIQRFLNDNLLLKESDKRPIIGSKNVKTHYNNYKGDVMFTFYNFNENLEWNFCYNERMDKWITRYSWTPLYSENINNIFYSMDKKRAETMSHIYDNKNCTYGLKTTNNLWTGQEDENQHKLTDSFSTDITLVGINLANSCTMSIKSIKTSYLNENNKEIEFSFPESWWKEGTDKFINFRNSGELTYTLSWNFDDMKRKFTDKNLATWKVPLYYKIEIEAQPYTNGIQQAKVINRTIGIVTDYDCAVEYADKQLYDNLLVNGFYVHGRAGIFDEVDYMDENQTDNITPTKWYNKQEPFEFEFVVNSEVGLHKIFDNLVIISNRVQPKSLEFEITGDVYSLFKKEGVYSKNSKKEIAEQFKNVTTKYDSILNQYSLVISQDLKDVEQFKRRLGNIHYKEDSWYVTIDPIIYDLPTRTRQSTRIRDKYLKVRVKYSGEDLVIITALKTLYNITYS